MNWYDMQCFVVLARTGSISKAAAELQQDRGAVARRVSDLQNALGSRLYVGNSKNFRLTPSGEMLLRELAPTEAAVQRVLAGVLPLKGLVTLTAAPTQRSVPSPLRVPTYVRDIRNCVLS